MNIANEHKGLFFECSAVQGFNVDEVVMAIVALYNDRDLLYD